MIYIYFFITSLINLSRNSVRFENSSGNRLSDRLNSVRFYLIEWGMACMYWKWYIVCTHTPDRSDTNENTQYIFMLKKIEKISLLASWPGAMINIHYLELPLSRTYFNGSKVVRAIEVLRYIQLISEFLVLKLCALHRFNEPVRTSKNLKILK